MMNMYVYIHISWLIRTGAYPNLNAEFKGPPINEPGGNINEAGSHPQAPGPFPITILLTLHPDFLYFSPSGGLLGVRHSFLLGHGGCVGNTLPSLTRNFPAAPPVSTELLLESYF